jgi:high-affinity iron transporter
MIACIGVARAAPSDGASQAQTIWRILDYLAVDYAGAVRGGTVTSESEYAEMQEFARSVQTRLAGLADTSAKAGLAQKADALVAAIAAKEDPDKVARIARGLAADLLVAYPVPLAPTQAPDLGRGAALYAEHCASCHGATGHGDGDAARGLNPPPIAFADAGRARQRSIFGLYQVITQGLEDTPMVSFDWLSSDDRWALAFHVSGLSFTDSQVEEGKRLWNADTSYHAAIPNLEALTQTVPASLGTRFGDEAGLAVMAYLRKQPSAVVSQDGPLALAKARLAESAAAYAAGDRAKANDLALSAYLDGVEPIEAALKARDASLVQRIEERMIALRAAISGAAPVSEIEAQLQEVSTLLRSAEQVLTPEHARSGATFVGAFTVLVREGLEAMLVIVAMLAFLRKTERADVIPYVHGGWVAALAAGVLTWFVATYFISISGAGRELTEGIGSLIAAVVLVSVGIWMHGKSHADAWQRYIREQISRVLSRKSAWFLFGLAFVVAYREVFETILFYIALWSQGNGSELLLGAGSGAVVLVGIAWALMNYSRKLPIGQFFFYSSILIAVLAVVLVGKGIAALQEAGWLGVKPIAVLPRVEIIGFYPTWQGIAGQLCIFFILAVAFWYNERSAAARRS